VGWCLLGRAIETATSAPWENAMRDHLLEPAGMHATTFVTGALPTNRATGHEVTTDGPVPVEPTTSRAYGPAGTSIVSTADDLLRFAALHLEDASLAALRSAHANVSISGWLDAWCLGWARFDWEGGPVWGWDGLISGERSVLRIAPEHQAAVVLLTNSSNGRAMYRSLFAELMDAWFGIRVPPLRLDPSRGAAGDLSRFAGVYAWPDSQLRVTATQHGLFIKGEGVDTEALPIDDRTFLIDAQDPDSPTVTFGENGDDGRPCALYSMLWGFPRIAG
jgi:CubicO group peptidase (beta-lactamase class C family)